MKKINALEPSTNINLKIRKAILEDLITEERKRVEFLHATPPVQGIVRAYSNQGIDPYDGTSLDYWLKRLEQTGKAFLQANEEILQLRLVRTGDEADEMARVDRVQGYVRVLAKEQLQSKKGRDYILAAQQLVPGEIAYSDINLNREFGKLEYPYWPVLRVFQGVFTEARELFAIVIINVDVTTLFAQASANLTENLELYITNEQGGFLVHPEQDQAFEFEFEPTATWENIFRPSRAEHGLEQVVNQQGESLYFRDKRVFFGARDTGTALNLIIGVKAAVIQRELQTQRQQSIFYLVIAFVITLTVLGLYQLQVHRKLRIAKREAEYSAIFESATDAIITMDNGGTIHNWNSAAETLFGHRAEFARAQSVFQLVFNAADSTITAKTLKEVANGAELRTFDSQSTTRNGKTLEISATLSPIRLQQHQVTGLAAIVRDVTKEKKAEAEILQLNQSLESKVQARTRELEQARNEALSSSRAKSDFIANVSHEIRTPMNGVLGMLALLERETLTPKQQRLLRTAEHSAKALTSLINDILDLSKIEAGKLDIEQKPFNLFEVLSNTAASLAVPAFEKGLDLSMDVSAIEHEWVFGDPNRLRQILINLIGNATKFTDQGHISIVAKTEAIENDALNFHCIVDDTGVGISEDNLKNLFQSFHQEDASVTRRFGGTGLGLAISRLLCEAMQGEIAVASKKGSGSRFSFRIRLLEDPGMTSSFPATQLPPLTALVVNDRAEASLVKQLNA